MQVLSALICLPPWGRFSSWTTLSCQNLWLMVLVSRPVLSSRLREFQTTLIPDSQVITRDESSHGNHKPKTASEFQGIPRNECCTNPNQVALNKPEVAEKPCEVVGKRRRGKRLTGNSQVIDLGPQTSSPLCSDPNIPKPIITNQTAC